jgi:hypothetical protein
MTPTHLRIVGAVTAFLFVALPVASTARDRTGDANEARDLFDRWSRSTTIIQTETEEFLKTYRDKLGALKDVKPDDVQRRIFLAYETAIEPMAGNAAPRIINPLIRARFGTLRVPTGDGNEESLSDALNSGRGMIENLFKSAYQVAIKGTDPLADGTVTRQLQAYVDHRQRITQAIANQLTTPDGNPGWFERIGPDKLLAFGFGVVFVVVMLVVAVFDRDPTDLGILIYRVVLALAAAGIGAVIPGMISLESPLVRAGGAIALFAIVYRLRPAELVAGPRVAKPRDSVVFDIPQGATFKQAADTAAAIAGVVIDLVGFTKEELAAPMAAGLLRSDNVTQLLTQLRFKTATPGAIREYTVSKKSGVYKFIVK